MKREERPNSFIYPRSLGHIALLRNSSNQNHICYTIPLIKREQHNLLSEKQMFLICKTKVPSVKDALNVNVLYLFFYNFPFEKGVVRDLNDLNSFHLRMVCAKFG